VVTGSVQVAMEHHMSQNASFTGNALCTTCA